MKTLVIVLGITAMMISVSLVRADDKVYLVQQQTVRYVTAYNVGDESQTDDTPCIGAANTDLCKALERGEKHCAANFVPLGTELYIDNYGVCKVTDRMNKRYKNRVDLAFPKSQLKEALTFGCQKLMVSVLKQVEE